MKKTKDEIETILKVKLSADGVKANLLVASTYLVAYELLYSTIVQGVEDFYFIVGDEEEEKKVYKEKVLSLNKDRLVASCLWLKNSQALTDEEIETISKIREHRNLIAHELPRIIIDHETEVDLDLFVQIITLHKRIELWWFEEVEMSINPDLADVEIEQVQTGRIMVMNLVVKTLLEQLGYGEKIRDSDV